MRLLVRGIRKCNQTDDHREFEDFRNELVTDLQSAEFAGFWHRLAPPPPPISPRLIEVLSLLCVT